MTHRQFDTVADWLEARSEGYGIGASTVAAVLGASSYRTPWDVWASHHAPEALPEVDAGQLRRGQLLEPHVFKSFPLRYEEQGHTARHVDRVICYHRSETWARCSPDGFVYDAEQQDGPPVGLIEVKTARNGWAWRDAPDEIRSAEDLDTLPVMAYGIQCYWQLLVTGLDWVDLIVVIMSNDAADIADALALNHPEAMETVARHLGTIKAIRIYRDPAFVERLGARVAAWREAHLVQGTEPEAAGALAAAYHGNRRKIGHLTVADDHPVIALADCLHDAKQAKKVIDQRVKHYTGRLKQALQNVRAVEASRGVVKWRKVGRGMSVALSDWVPSEAPVEPDNVPTLQPEESDHD